MFNHSVIFLVLILMFNASCHSQERRVYLFSSLGVTKQNNILNPNSSDAFQESSTTWYYPNIIGGGIGCNLTNAIDVEISMLSVSYKTSFLFSSPILVKRIQDDVNTSSLKIPIKVSYKILDERLFFIAIFGGYQIEFSSRQKGLITEGFEQLTTPYYSYESKYSNYLRNNTAHFLEAGFDLSTRLSKKIDIYNRIGYQHGLTEIYETKYAITQNNLKYDGSLYSNGTAWNYSFGIRFYI